ncbi:MAG: hypothetical protein ACXWUG_19045 [Polyangiales bacterium]
MRFSTAGLFAIALGGCTVNTPFGGDEVSVEQYYRERSVAVCDQMERCRQLGKYKTHFECVKQMTDTVCGAGACDQPGNARKLRDSCVPAERERACNVRGPLPECDVYKNPIE